MLNNVELMPAKKQLSIANMSLKKRKVYDELCSEDPRAIYRARSAFTIEERYKIIMGEIKTPFSQEVLQNLFDDMWDLDTDKLFEHLMRTEGSYDGWYNALLNLVEKGGFPKTKWNQETVTVYRGIRDFSKDRFQDGLVWSLNYDYAASEAISYANRNDLPLVLRADVPAKSIPFYAQPYPGNDVLVIDGPRGEVYGNEADWREAHERYRDSDEDVTEHDDVDKNQSLAG